MLCDYCFNEINDQSFEEDWITTTVKISSKLFGEKDFCSNICSKKYRIWVYSRLLWVSKYKEDNNINKLPRELIKIIANYVFGQIEYERKIKKNKIKQ
jgi:hypothetical protein